MNKMPTHINILINCFIFAINYASTSFDNYSIVVISEPVLNGDIVYEFKRIVRKTNFSDLFKKIIKRYKKVGYNMDVMRQSAMSGFKTIHAL